jgi:serine/threonine-protein kinase
MDRWQQISGIFQAALTRDPRERESYLDSACEGDEELRRQVESLLDATEQTRSVRLSGSSRGVGPAPAEAPLFGPGTRLSRYTIVTQLGAGGMGEVYRARDEQLDRDVAVKVLPAESFDDPTARARLVREARAAAALNHPNVCHVYEVGEAEGQSFIAMELVEGETLSWRLGRGPLPPEDVFDIGRQLADALAHAHDRGVVHRDLKSNNVIVTPDGRVKVLDFGLAKRLADQDLAAAVTQMHASLTQPGLAVGTLPYMSPEQLRGEPATVASDIWALGVVLYEMAAGVRPFGGQTPFDLSAAILNQTPAPLPSSVPAPLRAVIDRCLERDPRARPDTAAAVRRALEAPRTGSSGDALDTDEPRRSAEAAPPVVTVTLTRRRAIWMGGTAAIAGLAGIAGWRFRSGVSSARSLAVLPFANTAGDEDLEYLCDGIAESLIQQVSRLRSFRVRPLGVVLDFKGPYGDPQSAGRRLGVDTVLAGTLERGDTQLRISARLVDVETGNQLWASTYDRDAASLLDVQEEIAGAIMDDGLRVRLSSTEREALVRQPTTNGDAYDLYLQSRYLQRLATEEDYLYSRELLERALVNDPKFGLAYLALAANYAMMVVDGLVRPTDAWPQVNKYHRQGLALDPGSPYAFTMEHAVAFLFDWDWEGAETARRRFLTTQVGDFDPQTTRNLAVELWALGRPAEALQLARRARELDPRSPYLAILEADYLLRSDQFDAAVALYEYVIGADPANANAYFGLAEARALQGRFDEAIAVRQQAHAVAGDERMAPVFEGASGEAGYRRIDEAWVRLQLEVLQEREKTRYVSPLDFARAYAQLGEKEPAFKYLEAAFADRSPGLVFLKVDRAWDLVRDDPRFADAVRQVGLP